MRIFPGATGSAVVRGGIFVFMSATRIYLRCSYHPFFSGFRFERSHHPGGRFSAIGFGPGKTLLGRKTAAVRPTLLRRIAAAMVMFARISLRSGSSRSGRGDGKWHANPRQQIEHQTGRGQGAPSSRAGRVEAGNITHGLSAKGSTARSSSYSPLYSQRPSSVKQPTVGGLAKPAKLRPECRNPSTHAPSRNL